MQCDVCNLNKNKLLQHEYVVDMLGVSYKIPNVEVHTDLGIIVDASVSFKTHMYNRINKAYKV